MQKVLLISLGLTASHVMAAAPTWDYVQLSYVQAQEDEDSIGFKPKGPKLFLSKALTDNTFLTGSYVRLQNEFDGFDLEVDQVTVGLGYNYSLTSNTDIFGAISFESFDTNSTFADASASAEENGYGLMLGIRSMVMAQVEAKAALRYVEIDAQNNTGLALGMDYLVTPHWAIGANYEIGEDSDLIGLNLRYNF